MVPSVAKQIPWETIVAMRAQADEMKRKKIFRLAQIIDVVARDHKVSAPYTRKILNGDHRKTS